MHELPEPKTEDDYELNITQYTNWHRVLSNLEVVFDTETDILNYGRSKELDYLIKNQFNQTQSIGETVKRQLTIEKQKLQNGWCISI